MRDAAPARKVAAIATSTAGTVAPNDVPAVAGSSRTGERRMLALEESQDLDPPAPGGESTDDETAPASETDPAQPATSAGLPAVPPALSLQRLGYVGMPWDQGGLGLDRRAGGGA